MRNEPSTSNPFVVHYWPHLRTISMMNAFYPEPVWTYLTVQHSSDVDAHAGTMVIASALAGSANPAGELIEHRADGTAHHIDRDSMKPTALPDGDALAVTSGSDEQELREAIWETRRACTLGDSNDGEIDSLRNALELALGRWTGLDLGVNGCTHPTRDENEADHCGVCAAHLGCLSPLPHREVTTS